MSIFFFPFRTKIIEICSNRKQSYRGVKSNLSVHIHTKIQVQATIKDLLSSRVLKYAMQVRYGITGIWKENLLCCLHITQSDFKKRRSLCTL